MRIDEHTPGYYNIKVVDQDGNDMLPERIRSVDTNLAEYTRYERDGDRFTGALELVRCKKIEWCWHTRTVTITRDE